jgi:hypothetical protein
MDMEVCQLVGEQTKTQIVRRYGFAGVILVLILANAGISRVSYSQEAKEPHTEAAVIAADKGWDKAEDAGDVAFIDQLLLPEYRSISSDGSVHDKAAIIASARKNVSSPERKADAEKWRTAHPSLTSVAITGDTAVLSFTLDRSGSPVRIMSSDIFVYRDGHWRALYSQHSEAGK